jgi:hypothetical protein
MQVYAGTLAQLIRDGATPALIFADREAGQLALRAESRAVRLRHRSGPQKRN